MVFFSGLGKFPLEKLDWASILQRPRMSGCSKETTPSPQVLMYFVKERGNTCLSKPERSPAEELCERRFLVSYPASFLLLPIVISCSSLGQKWERRSRYVCRKGEGGGGSSILSEQVVECRPPRSSVASRGKGEIL
uniref:Uncharacterized protein n=1 Tax=Micrurus corallinus TaxID=54390 RepID=A0A2D4FQP8_MICCO